jgi:hypothetical protein
MALCWGLSFAINTSLSGQMVFQRPVKTIRVFEIDHVTDIGQFDKASTRN